MGSAMPTKLATLTVVFLLSFSAAALAHDMRLEGTEWGVVSDNASAARFVSFAGEKRVFGFSGCNRFSGEYEQTDNQLLIKPLATTRMACPPDMMKREEEFLAMLGQVHSVVVEHTMLMLLDEGGAQITTLVRRAAE